jgi:hypothetical protein
MDLLINGALTVRLEGSERLTGMRRQVVVPSEEIRAVRFHQRWQDPGRAWRATGTGMPRVLYAGYFRRRGQWEFWFLRRPKGVRRPTAANVLEVETTGRFARLLLSTTPEDAARVESWFARSG